MFLAYSFPVGCVVLNLGHMAEVVGHKVNVLKDGSEEAFLIVRGMGDAYEFGEWIALPDKCYRLSTNHMGFSHGREYYVQGDSVYRAPETNPVSLDGYRAGGRFVVQTRFMTAELSRQLGLLE